MVDILKALGIASTSVTDDLQSQIENCDGRLGDLETVTALDGKSDDQIQQEFSNLKNQLQAATNAMAADQATIDNLNSQLISMQPMPDPPLPAYINTSAPAYKPYIQVTIPTNNQLTAYRLDGYQLPWPQAIFSTSRRLQDVVRSMGWDKLPTRYQKLMAIWTWVLNPNTRTYMYDYGDNWQFPEETIARHGGDCEDGTVLFVTLCQLAGIPADQVFLVVGPTQFGYHCYPIAFMDDNALSEARLVASSGWYIFESTINIEPANPMALVGSVYHIDNGLSNWLVSGQLQGDHTPFNGTPAAGIPGAPQDGRVENSQQKHDAILKHWIEHGHVKVR